MSNNKKKKPSVADLAKVTKATANYKQEAAKGKGVQAAPMYVGNKPTSEIATQKRNEAMQTKEWQRIDNITKERENKRLAAMEKAKKEREEAEKKKRYGTEYELVKKVASGEADEVDKISYNYYKRVRERETNNTLYYLNKSIDDFAKGYNSLGGKNYVSADEYDKIGKNAEKINESINRAIEYYELYGSDKDIKEFEKLRDNFSNIMLESNRNKKIMSQFKNENEYNAAREANGVASYAELRQKRDYLQRQKGNGNAADIDAKLNALDKYGLNSNVIKSMSAEDWEHEKERISAALGSAQSEHDRYNSTAYINAHYEDAVNKRGLSEDSARDELQSIIKNSSDKVKYYSDLLNEMTELARMSEAQKDIDAKWGIYAGHSQFDANSVPRLKKGASGDVDYDAINYGVVPEAIRTEHGTPENDDAIKRAKKLANNISDEEKRIYNFVYNTYGAEKAEQYLESIEVMLNKRHTLSEQARAFEQGQEKPWQSAIYNRLISPLRTAEGLINNVVNIGTTIAGGEIDPYADRFMSSNLSPVLDEGVKTNIDSRVGKFIYSAATQAAELALNMAVSKGIGGFAGKAAGSANANLIANKVANVANQVLLSSNSMLSTTLEYKKSGASDLAALGMGMISGAIEAWTERKSLSNLLKSPDIFNEAKAMAKLGKWTKKIGVDAAKEGWEEIEANLYNTLAAFIFEQRNNDSFLAAYDEAIKNGYAENKAFWEAVKAVSPEYLESFAVGALAGGMFGAANTASGVHTYNQVRDDASAFFEDKGYTKSSVMEYLIKNGVSEDTEIARLSDAIVHKANGQMIDDSEIKESPFLSGVLMSYVEGATIGDGSTESESKTAKSATKSTEPVIETAKSATENREISLSSVSESDPEQTQRSIGRNGSKTYLSAITEGDGGLVDSLISEGYSTEDALSKTDQLFNYLYDQGRKGKDKDIAMHAASEYILSGHEADALLFYNSGKNDADGLLIGKTNARLIANNTLRQMRKDGSINYRTERAINALASKLGINIEFNSTMSDGKLGAFNAKTGRLMINSNAKNKFFITAVHESVHALRSIDPESYNKLTEIVYETLSKNEDVYNEAWGNLFSRYKKEATKDGNLNKDLITEELTAKVVSHLLADEKFIKELAKSDRGTVQRIYDAVVDLFQKIFKRYSENTIATEKDVQAAIDELKSEFKTISTMFETALESTKGLQQDKMKLLANNASENAESDNVLFSKAEKEAEEIIFSPTADAKNKFAQKVDAWYNGELREDDYFELGDTPFVLKVLGAKDLPVVYDMNVMYKMTNGYHSIYKDVIKELPTAINNPLMVFNSSTVNNALVLVTELTDKSGDAIVVAVHLSKLHKRMKINRVASAYGKIGIERFIDTESKKGQLRYVDIKKCQQWSTNRGLQLPKLVQSITDNNNILQKEDIVNSYFMQYAQNDAEFQSKDDSVAIEKGEVIPKAPKYRKLADRIAPSLQLREEILVKLDEHIKKYGTMEKGANAVRDVSIPKKTSDDDRNVRRFTRTAIESDTISDDEAVKLMEDIASGKAWTTYQIAGDKKTTAVAYKTLENRGFEKMLNEWDALLESGKKISKQDIVNAQILAQEASKKGDAKTTCRLIAEIAAELTEAGQLVQAASLMKKLGASANVYNMERTIDRVQREITKRYKNKAPTLKKPTDLIEKYQAALENEAKNGNKDHTESNKYADMIYYNISQQIPADWRDKINTWRYFAMLGNVRTHLRNLVGNAAFAPTIMLKNIIATTGETLFIRDIEKRTKSYSGMFSTGAEYQFAKKDADKIELQLRGNSKYGATGQITDKRTIYEKGAASKLLETITKKENAGIMNILTKANSNLLEKEDWLFLKPHYARALTMWMKAQKVTPETITEKQLDIARIYAVREAQKATFRDASSFASYLSMADKFSTAVETGVSSVMPFKKTPVNILKRGVEYSPVGLMKSLTKGLYDVRNGKITATEFIDDIASGLSGSAILGLGIYLTAAAILNGRGSDDEEENILQTLGGMQNYSLNVGGGTYTIDWLAPSAMPLFVGCEMYNAFKEGGMTFADIMEALPRITEPVFEMSMLESLSSLVERASYEETSSAKLGAIVADLPASYLGQFVPTLLGQIARTIDPTRRKIYIDKDSSVPDWIQSFVQQQAKKIPGVSFMMEPYVNARGEQELNAEGNVFSRAFQNFLSPGYYKKMRSTAVDDEMARLYAELGESASGIMPKTVQKYITVNGERVNLSAEQYSEYQRTTGQSYYKKLGEIISSDYYKALADEQKVDLLEKAKEYAVEKGKDAALPQYKFTNGWLKTAFETDGGFQYILDLDKKESFSEKNLQGESFDKYESDRETMFDSIISNYKPNGSDYALADKYYDNLYSFTHRVALEKNANGKYAIDTKWMKTAKTLNPKDQAEFIYGTTALSLKDFKEYKDALGKTVSRKQQVCEYIGRLNISNKIKSYLFREEYKDRTSKGKSNIAEVTWQYEWLQ